MNTNPTHELDDSAAPSQGAFVLSELDVRAMVHLLGHVAGLDGDQAVKRRELMSGLCELIDADAWAWSMARRATTDEGWTSVGLIHEGFSEQELVRLAEASIDPPEGRHFDPLLTMNKQATRTRRQLMDDAIWYEHPHTRQYRQGWLDDFIYSLLPIGNPPAITSVVAFHRRWGRPPFTPRDARMVHIVTSEVRWLHSAAVPDEVVEQSDGLSPRLRSILILLLQGYARKQMAHHLQISQHTVNDYVKALYRHFNVSSGPELMRRFMAGDGGDMNDLHSSDRTSK